MNNDKRILAFVSLGLCVATPLAPFFIAALGRADLAISFAIVAALLTVLFGVLSWKEYLGRIVTVVLPAVVVVGVLVVLAIHALHLGEEEVATPAEIRPPQPPPGGIPGR